MALIHSKQDFLSIYEHSDAFKFGLTPATVQNMLRVISNAVMNTCGGLYVSGLQNIREPIAVNRVYTPNHTSYLDGPAIGATLLTLIQEEIIPDQLVSVIVMDNLIHNSGRFAPLTRKLYELAGFLPVDIDPEKSKGASKELVRHMIKMRQDVKNDIPHGLIIFPEGIRNNRLGTLKSGVITLADKTGSVVVPTGITGPETIWPRDARLPTVGVPTVIHFGEPMTPDDNSQDFRLAELRERIAEATSQSRDVQKQLL